MNVEGKSNQAKDVKRLPIVKGQHQKFDEDESGVLLEVQAVSTF
ncbi:hypothetical protein [Liquorilactobacillus sp.]